MFPELTKLGFTEGRNFIVDARFGPMEELPALARQLARLTPMQSLPVVTPSMRRNRRRAL
jgi:hypothetical protein